MTIPIDPHAWFREHLDAFVAGGLSPDERRALESHAAVCAACEAALNEAKQADEALRTLFAPIAPPSDFEETLLMNFRSTPAARPMLHPNVIRSAAGLAAAVMLGGLGLIGHRAMKDGKFPQLSIPSISMPRFAWLTPAKPSSDIGRKASVEIGSAISGPLAKRLPEVNFQGNNFADVVDFLRDVSGAKIDVNWKALESAGITKEAPVTARLKDVPLNDALRVILNDVGGGIVKVGVAADGDVLTISTAEDLATRSPLEEAKAVQEQQRTSRSEFDAKLDASLKTAETTHVPYDDILRYPPNWGDISQVRDGEASKTLTYGLTGGLASPQGKVRPTMSAYDGGTLLLGGQTLNGTTEANGRNLDRLGENRSHRSDTLAFDLQGGLGNDMMYRSPGSNNHRSVLEVSQAAKAPAALYFKPDENGRNSANEVTHALKKRVEPDGVLNLAFKPSAGDSAAAGDPQISGLGRGERDEKLLEEESVKHTNGLAGDASAKPAAAALTPFSGDYVVKVALGDGEKAGIAPESAQPAKPKPEPAKPVDPTATVPPIQQQMQRKIIRNGQMEFEVDSFDSSFMQLGKIVGEEGGYISSTDSEKLTNGKVKGTVTLRVPPDHLDVLVLKLRGLGDLKNQRIAAQDITKQFTDLESGLRASRTMETRLLEIIKNGKGEVKDLVEAEKQLGTYREKIEQIEGELRYYSNLVSLSTLNVTLLERDIKSPTAAFETEQVQAGIEVEDVEKARADALKAIDEAKGRVIESNLKKLDAGQLTATIVAEMTPEAAGPFTDRLKQLGRVARLEADRKQTTQGGVGAPVGLKMERKATRFNVSLYNLANIAPRETVNLTLAAEDVEKAYKAILDAMRGEIGRVVSSTLTRPKLDQATGALLLEVRGEQAAALDAAIRGLGDVMTLSVTESPDQNNVTRAKRGYNITLVSSAQVPPRETQTLQVVAKGVPATYARLLAVLQDGKRPSRILLSQLNEQDRQNITGQIEADVPRAAVGLVEAALAGGDSDVYSRNVSRANDAQNTLDTKVRLTMTLVAADRLPPRESTKIAVEVGDVEKTLADVIATADASGGRTVKRQLSKSQNGRIAAQAIIDVPLASASATADKLRGLGTVRLFEASKDPQIPDSPLARARFDLTLGDAAPIVSAEDGVGASLRKGLQTSINGLTFSLMLIVVGVCLVGPFALLIWGGWKFYRREKKKPVTA